MFFLVCLYLSLWLSFVQALLFDFCFCFFFRFYFMFFLSCHSPCPTLWCVGVWCDGAMWWSDLLVHWLSVGVVRHVISSCVFPPWSPAIKKYREKYKCYVIKQVTKKKLSGIRVKQQSQQKSQKITKNPSTKGLVCYGMWTTKKK